MAAKRPGDTFPTFLDTDPFPSRASEGRPTTSPSVTTSATSETEEEGRSVRGARNNAQGATGPVGEPGLPPSRPINAGPGGVSSQRRGPSRPPNALPNSRRGLASYAARSRGSLRHNDNGSADMRADSTVSRTHVPSLTAQGFSQPLSSQRLQAQRGQQQATSLSQAVSTRSSSVGGGSQLTHRYSNASVNTLRDGPPPARAEDVPPLPTSRSMNFAEDSKARARGQSAVHGFRDVPLHDGEHLEPLKLELSGLRSLNTSPQPRSLKSFRSSLGRGSRRESRPDQERRRTPRQHEKLRSEPPSPRDEEKSIMPVTAPNSASRGGKNYEYFAGNMLFFVEGRCLNARTRPLNLATFILTTLPVALFFGFSAPWLWHNVSPAIPIIFAYVFYLTISSLLHAALSDPGILPRNLHPHPSNLEEDDPLTVGPPTTEWVMVKTFPSKRQNLAGDPSSAEAQRGVATAMEVPTKYCKTCNIWRPPRAHHCRVCDACIETQDHHCVWLNNCVGRRNYRFFFSYVGIASVLALLLIAFSLTHVAMYGRRTGVGFRGSLSGRPQERVAFAMFLYSILALPYPGSLFVYHLFLSSRGETTREYLNSHKFLPKDRHRPFSQSTEIRNMLAVLLRPRPPTYMHFKHRYQEGDVRFGHLRTKKERRRDLEGRYSVQNGSSQEPKQPNGHEMQHLPPLPKPQARPGSLASAGGLHQPMNSTPRQSYRTGN